MQNTNVPQGWNFSEFGTFAFLVKDKYEPDANEHKRCIELEHIEKETGKLISVSDSSTHTSVKNKFATNDVLFGKLRPYLKKYYKPDFEGVCSTEIWVLRGKREIIQEYLFLLIQSDKFISACNVSTGSRMPRADWSFVSETPFLLPPIEEQKKIAEILGTWDRAIEELTGLIAEKKELKRGLMQQLLTGTQRLPGFTKPWKKDFLSNLCDIETGKKDVNEGNPTGQYPFFTCAKTHTFADTFSYDKEAILIAGNGDVGNCQYYNGKFEAYQRTYILSNFRTDVRLLFQILDTKMSRYAESQKQQGAMPYIKLGALTDFIVYMPEDFAEQKAIAEVLTKADAEIDLLNQQLDVLREQKRGLMQKLLTGEIRVKVDNE